MMHDVSLQVKLGFGGAPIKGSASTMAWWADGFAGNGCRVATRNVRGPPACSD